MPAPRKPFGTALLLPAGPSKNNRKPTAVQCDGAHVGEAVTIWREGRLTHVSEWAPWDLVLDLHDSPKEGRQP